MKAVQISGTLPKLHEAQEIIVHNAYPIVLQIPLAMDSVTTHCTITSIRPPSWQMSPPRLQLCDTVEKLFEALRHGWKKAAQQKKSRQSSYTGCLEGQHY